MNEEKPPSRAEAERIADAIKEADRFARLLRRLIFITGFIYGALAAWAFFVLTGICP